MLFPENCFAQHHKKFFPIKKEDVQRARTHARYTSSVTVSQLTFEVVRWPISHSPINSILETGKQRSSENDKHLFQQVGIYNVSAWQLRHCLLRKFTKFFMGVAIII